MFLHQYYVTPTQNCYLEENEQILRNAPQPNPNTLRGKGKRPHKHNDWEGDFAAERHVKYEALAKMGHPKADKAKEHQNLPLMAAYPAVNDFNYDKQPRKPKVGPNRIVTNMNKNPLGMVYHPENGKPQSVEDQTTMIQDFERAKQGGAFIADFRAPTFKDPRIVGQQPANNGPQPVRQPAQGSQGKSLGDPTPGPMKKKMSTWLFNRK